MSYIPTLNTVIPSLWSIYPEFNILKYVCKTGAKQRRFKHVTLEDVILDPYLKEWFIDYFQFDRRKINFNWVGQKGFVNCIKYLKKQKKNYPSNYLHHLLLYTHHL